MIKIVSKEQVNKPHPHRADLLNTLTAPLQLNQMVQ
jgi:hypothetical protein